MPRGDGRRVYTKLGKWSSGWFLGIISLYTLISMLSVASSPVFRSDRSLVGIAFLTALLGLAALVAILGILKEQVWAKWLAVAIYGWVGLSSANALIYSIGNLISRNASGEVETALRLASSMSYLSALTRICMVGIGITLVLQKPKSQGND